MKATGIVRRIDELGRIVIPKEMRRTLSICEGDSLEIFADGEKLVLSKYQEMIKLSHIACDLCKSASASFDFDIAICDSEKVIARGGENFSEELMGKELSQRAKNAIFARKNISPTPEKTRGEVIVGVDFTHFALSTIIANSEAPGCVICHSKNTKDTEKLAEVSSFCANLLARNLTR